MKTLSDIAKQPASNTIRTFEQRDIDAVIRMSRNHFPVSRQVPESYLRTVLTELFFSGRSTLCPSLVSISKRGDVNGFLGVTVKPFSYRGESLSVAHCNHFMVNRDGRSSLAPIRMLQKFLSGPQDLSFADGSVEASRILWERLGGLTSKVHSIYYKVPLRPLSFVSRLTGSSLPPAVGKLVALGARGVDTAAGLLRIPLFRQRPADTPLIPLNSTMLLEGYRELFKAFTLTPVYDLARLDRTFRLLKNEKRYGTLQKIAMLDEDRKPAGWFIYYSTRNGVCEVLQAECLPGFEDRLHRALCWHAFTHGGIELSGRLSPGHFKTRFTARSVTLPGRMWTLIDSRDRELLLDIQSGKAFLTRLEGDLWLI